VLRALPRIGALALTLVNLACGLSSTERYQVEGVIQGVDRERSQVLIAHQDIPNFMPAMTMSFDVASPSVLEGVVPGDRVRFVLERNATLLVVSEIDVLEAGAGISGGGLSPLANAEPAPDFELTDQAGALRSLSDLRGQAILLDFVFTRCPGPCPLLTAAHAELQRQLPAALAARTHLVSISLDPAYDTPERLLAYADARGADLSRWWFLTGAPEPVSDVVRAYQVGSIRQPDGLIDHTVITFLIDPQGRIVQRYFGLTTPAADIIRDVGQVLG